MKRSIIVLITLCLIATLAAPAFGQYSLGLTYLYGRSDTSDLNQLKGLQNELDVVMPDYFDINTESKVTIKVNKDFIKQAKDLGYRVVPFVSNHFDKTAAHNALINQDSVIKQIITAVDQYNLDGINLDLENIPLADKEAYNSLVEKLANKLHSRGKTLSIALPAVDNFPAVGWMQAYDFETLANYADYVILMTYDEHWLKPGPIASVPWVDHVIKAAVEVIPSEKIMLGLPFYGRHWINNQRVNELSYQQVLDVAATYFVQAQWDDESQSPLLKFKDYNGDLHEIWYENAASLKIKLNLIDKYDLAGAASWRLGLEDPAFWQAYNQFLSNQPVQNAVFKDVFRHWAYDDITFLYEEGLIGGYQDNTFRPNAKITRAEVTAILERWLQFPDSQKTPYRDVPSKHWAYDDILAASAGGVISGYADGTFRPGQSITRAELASLLSRVFGDSHLQGSGFQDVESSHWAYDAIVAMQGQGLISGYSDGLFKPEAPVTRAEFSAMLARSIKSK